MRQQKSHRGNKDRELIKFEENEAHIRIHFEKQGIDHQLDMHLKKIKQKVWQLTEFRFEDPVICWDRFR